jgi:hypothetical protein
MITNPYMSDARANVLHHPRAFVAEDDGEGHVRKVSGSNPDVGMAEPDGFDSDADLMRSGLVQLARGRMKAASWRRGHEGGDLHILSLVERGRG